jgi:hypothetical protein
VPGTYVVLARDRAGWVGVSPAIVLGAGRAEAGREVELRPGARLSVRYQGERDLVTVEILAGGRILETTQAHRGAILELSVPPGSLEVRRRSQNSTQSKSVAVAAGASAEVVLDDGP